MLPPPPPPPRVVHVQPRVLFDRLDDPPPKGKDPFEVGDLAGFIPDAFVDGHAFARVAQNPIDDDTPRSSIVNVHQTFGIDVYWDLTGPLIPAFCGNWAITIYFESMGPDEWDFQIEAVPDNIFPFGCNILPYNRDRHTRLYHAGFTVPADIVKVDPHRGTPYELNVSLVLLASSSCDGLPAGIVGSIKLEDILFYSEP